MIDERRIVKVFNDYIGCDLIERSINTGNQSFRCFVVDEFERGEILNGIRSFEQDGLFFDVISIGISLSTGLLRYIDVRVSKLK